MRNNTLILQLLFNVKPLTPLKGKSRSDDLTFLTKIIKIYRDLNFDPFTTPRNFHEPSSNQRHPFRSYSGEGSMTEVSEVDFTHLVV